MSFHELDNEDPDVTIELNGRGTMDVATGEFRMLLVPEYAITERWTVGSGVGAVVSF